MSKYTGSFICNICKGVQVISSGTGNEIPTKNPHFYVLYFRNTQHQISQRQKKYLRDPESSYI